MIEHSTPAWVTTFVAPSTGDYPNLLTLGFTFWTFDTIHVVAYLSLSAKGFELEWTCLLLLRCLRRLSA